MCAQTYVALARASVRLCGFAVGTVLPQASAVHAPSTYIASAGLGQLSHLLAHMYPPIRLAILHQSSCSAGLSQLPHLLASADRLLCAPLHLCPPAAVRWRCRSPHVRPCSDCRVAHDGLLCAVLRIVVCSLRRSPASPVSPQALPAMPPVQLVQVQCCASYSRGGAATAN